MPQYTRVDRKHYELLAQLWSGGWNEYQTLGAGFVTAHSIIVGGIVLLLQEERVRHHLLAVVVSAAGLFLALQMKGALGKCSAKANYFSWQLRGLESETDDFGIFQALEYHLESEYSGKLANQLFDASRQDHDLYKRNYATTFHRRNWLRRMASLPAVFAAMYTIATAAAAWALQHDWALATGQAPYLASPHVGLLGCIAAIGIILITIVCWFKLWFYESAEWRAGIWKRLLGFGARACTRTKRRLRRRISRLK